MTFIALFRWARAAMDRAARGIPCIQIGGRPIDGATVWRRWPRGPEGWGSGAIPSWLLALSSLGSRAMPYDLRIICGRDFLRLDAQGHFDMPATRQLLYDAIWACSNSRVGRVLIDVRDATANFSAMQLVALAGVCHEVSVPPDHHKIAILTRGPVRLERASCLAALTRGDGWNIEAFCEFERAFNWLIT